MGEIFLKPVGEFPPRGSPDSIRNGALDQPWVRQAQLLVASLTLPLLRQKSDPRPLHAHTQAAQPSLPGPEAREPHILQGDLPLKSPPTLNTIHQWLL